jgi:transposase InsO family protein
MKCWDKNYLVTVDYYSIFWEIDYVENTLSSTIINKLRSHFSRHGIPDIVFSDNGPQFDCSEFRKFASLWEFKHETSSPLYPQSNGKVEQAVKTAKQLM